MFFFYCFSYPQPEGIPFIVIEKKIIFKRLESENVDFFLPLLMSSFFFLLLLLFGFRGASPLQPNITSASQKYMRQSWWTSTRSDEISAFQVCHVMYYFCFASNLMVSIFIKLSNNLFLIISLPGHCPL